MTKANYHVSGNRLTGYSVRREGASRASVHTTAKAQAEKVAKQFSRNQGGGEVRIHRSNGQIMDSDTIPNEKIRAHHVTMLCRASIALKNEGYFCVVFYRKHAKIIFYLCGFDY